MKEVIEVGEREVLINGTYGWRHLAHCIDKVCAHCQEPWKMHRPISDPFAVHDNNKAECPDNRGHNYTCICCHTSNYPHGCWPGMICDKEGHVSEYKREWIERHRRPQVLKTLFRSPQ